MQRPLRRSERSGVENFGDRNRLDIYIYRTEQYLDDRSYCGVITSNLSDDRDDQNISKRSSHFSRIRCTRRRTSSNFTRASLLFQASRSDRLKSFGTIRTIKSIRAIMQKPGLRDQEREREKEREQSTSRSHYLPP